MKKILYIAFYYNHNNEIASKRLQGVAKYLPDYGFKPVVLTPETENPTVEFNNVEVVETEYKDMADRFLPKKKTGSVQSTTESSNTLISKLVHIAGEVFAYPDGMKYWYRPAFEKSCEIIESEDICAIISSSFPTTSHIIAHDLAEKYNISWIADLRDLWNLNPYVNHFFIRSYLEKRLEKKTFENATILTTTTELARDTLKTLHPNKKIVSVLSGYDSDDFTYSKPENSNSQLTLVYAGSLYGGKRDPSILFDAVKQLIDESKIDPSKISINFYGDESNLRQLSCEFDIESIVHIHGKVSHSEVLKKQMNADVLLLISWMSEKEKMFIPGKVYEYMASKKPVLSIGYPEGSLKDLIEKTEIGYHVSDVEDTKNAVLDYYQKFLNNELEYSGNESFKKYTMRNTAKKYSELLEEII